MRKTPGWIEGGGGVSRMREGCYSPLPPLLSSAGLSSLLLKHDPNNDWVGGGGGRGGERRGQG